MNIRFAPLLEKPYDEMHLRNTVARGIVWTSLGADNLTDFGTVKYWGMIIIFD